MCTVALAHQLYPGLPILVAANRDEQRSRPSTSWRSGGLAPLVGEAIDHDDGAAVFAPRDRVAGGTWIGLAPGGRIAAITNRFGHGRDPTRRSRGLLVLEALGAPDVDRAADAIAALAPESVSPFHLLIADAEHAALVFHDGERIERRAVAPGWTVITERSLGAAPADREARVRARLESFAAAPTPAELHQLLGVHTTGTVIDERVAATCVHLDEIGYGTRSSSLYYGDPSAPRLFHADGPPCVTVHADLSAELRAFERRTTPGSASEGRR